MPQELMKDFIGKACCITLLNEICGTKCKILAVEDNWVKVEEKNKIRIINGDMIKDISLVSEKCKK